jgi:hypothetical protein
VKRFLRWLAARDDEAFAATDRGTVSGFAKFLARTASTTLIGAILAFAPLFSLGLIEQFGVTRSPAWWALLVVALLWFLIVFFTLLFGRSQSVRRRLGLPRN